MSKVLLPPFVTFILSSLFLSGCATRPRSQQAGAAAPPPCVAAKPVKIALMLDKTDSANSTRTQQPNLDMLQPLVNCLRSTGGELAVGLISDDSNKPLLRLRIEPPPQAPSKPPEGGDADEVAQRLDRYNNDANDYQARLTAWASSTDDRLKKFTDDVQPLLSQAPTAHRSDVLNALNRSDLYLAEKDPDFPEGTQRLIILNSDCQDNVRAPLNKLRSNAQLFVVNGVGSVGSLAQFNPVPFESLTSAINYVVQGGK
jgi:hypothetical protein